MKKRIFLFFMFVNIFYISNGQIYIDNAGNVYDQRKSTVNVNNNRSVVPAKKSSGFDPSKLSIGGSFGLQFGDYTLVNISPQIGYDISKYATLGAGFGYTYFRKDYGYADYKQSYFTFDLFSRIYPIENIVISIQPEISRMWQTVESRNNKYSESKFVPSLVVGGGVRYAGMIAMIQYDVIQDNNSPYGNSIFYSVGYYFNF